ncbi:MORN repeat-containing protein 3 isoform X1 [Bos indicus]|uniref:MORN repeat-containing protein 3 n=1 Tax=Bos indicus TaxID=9915 RepID=A0ABM4QQP4_BOSIN
MPIFKCPQKSEPLWKEWDQKAQKNGLRHQVFAVNGDHYVGEWKDNVKHGKGTQVWKKNGAIYEGDWKSGKRDGYGTLSLPDQETGKYKRAYSGWWKGDKKCGYGIQFFGPKEYYEGDWCGNQRSGWGRMYYSNGDIYEGQWRNDKPEGEGMLRLSQNSRSRRCVGGSLGHVQEDKRRRRLMPAPSTPRPCRENTSASGGIQTGVTQLLGPVQLLLEEQVGTHPWHLQKAPYSFQHWLIPSQEEASASLPCWPWGPSCYCLFSWTSSLSAPE